MKLRQRVETSAELRERNRQSRERVRHAYATDQKLKFPIVDSNCLVCVHFYYIPQTLEKACILTQTDVTLI